MPSTRSCSWPSEPTIHLASGRTIDALTFNGTAPGPELRVRQGDLVDVVLENEDVEQGVTIHWHGVDVPNAADGVAGVTQNAVLPGERYRYRFRAEQVGTFWYHTHQSSSEDVRRGLFGALWSSHEQDRLRSSTWLSPFTRSPGSRRSQVGTTSRVEPLLPARTSACG